MNHKQEQALELTPDIIKLIAKVIRFSRGGFTISERQELAKDLLILVDKILEGVV